MSCSTATDRCRAMGNMQRCCRHARTLQQMERILSLNQYFDVEVISAKNDDNYCVLYHGRILLVGLKSPRYFSY